MKKLIALPLAALVGGLFAAPSPARADDGEVVAALAGFIGGVIVGAATHDDRCEAPLPAPRMHGSVSVVVGSRPRADHYDARCGHWDWVSVRVWVPATWVVRIDDCGRRHRYYERGHYEHRRERRWVVVHDRRCGHYRHGR